VCFGALLPKATFDPQALEAMRSHLTKEQYEALSAIASQDLLDVDAIAELRAASMI
jgi:NTP pyrophosphatase (non-canonical NTP hydrolase)